MCIVDDSGIPPFRRIDLVESGELEWKVSAVNDGDNAVLVK